MTEAAAAQITPAHSQYASFMNTVGGTELATTMKHTAMPRNVIRQGSNSGGAAGGQSGDPPHQKAGEP